MIHVVGLGGVGFWLAVGLSRVVNPEQLHCWDDDTLSGGTGSTRLPWGPEATKKVDLLRGYLSMVHAAPVLPQVSSRKFSGILGVGENDLIIDCTDMELSARKRMWTTVKNKGAKLLRVSYDGRGSRVIISTGLPLYGGGQGGYAAVPSLALSLAAGGLGAEAVMRYLEHPRESFTISIALEEAMQ